MRSYLGKAIADNVPGTEDPHREGTYHYTHLLPDNLRHEGYEVRAHDYIAEDGLPTLEVEGYAPTPDGLKSVGVLNTAYSKDKGVMSIFTSHVHPEHRSKGLGMSMYEAALTHAKQHLGLTHVRGGTHSTMAQKVHAKIAEKHGLTYDAEPAIGGAYDSKRAWDRAVQGSFDERYDNYKYTIKSEKIEVPTRFLEGSDLNLYDGAAMAQNGAWANLMVQLDGARRLKGQDVPGLPLSKARYIYAEDDMDDLAGVALQAYDLPRTDENRKALETVIGMPNFAKAEGVGLTMGTYKIAPANAEGVSTADAIQRAADGGYINAVQLNGKHSKGTMLAKDPQTKKVYLLKPGSGKNSPARGVNETSATQSERESAFWHVADKWGIGDVFPRADLILVNNHQTAAMELLGVSYRNMGTKKKEDRNLPARILEPYRQNATLFKWSLIDYVLGNPDRHSQNMMVDPDNRQVRLIDHGSALAGISFDPAEDDNSFIPFYLRAWTDRKFKEMNPNERMRAMPGLNTRAEQVFDQWVDGISEDSMAAMLRDYHIDPSPALERLAMIRAMPGPKWLVLNKLWAGAV